jgi:predicted RNase H-like nuclease
MIICGIDLAWSGETKTSGIAFGLLHGNVLTVTELISDICGLGNILGLLKSKSDLYRIAVDASLIITNKHGQRACEKDLSRAYGSRGVSCHATNLTLYPSPFSAELSEKLELEGYHHLATGGKWQIECYPHPAIIEIFGIDYRLRYKKGSVAGKRKGQIELSNHIRSLESSKVLELNIPEKHRVYLSPASIDNLEGTRLKQNEDCLDAIVCLYIAGLYAISVNHHVFGDKAQGYIYVPKQRCI